MSSRKRGALRWEPASGGDEPLHERPRDAPDVPVVDAVSLHPAKNLKKHVKAVRLAYSGPGDEPKKPFPLAGLFSEEERGKVISCQPFDKK